MQHGITYKHFNMKLIETVIYTSNREDDDLREIIGKENYKPEVEKTPIVLAFSDLGQFQFSLYPNTSSITNEPTTTMQGPTGDILHEFVEPIKDIIKKIKYDL